MSFDDFVELAIVIIKTEDRDFIKTIIFNARKAGFTDGQIINGFDKAIAKIEHLCSKHKVGNDDMNSALKSYKIMLDLIGSYTI